jgi:hypothetical protein
MIWKQCLLKKTFTIIVGRYSKIQSLQTCGVIIVQRTITKGMTQNALEAWRETNGKIRVFDDFRKLILLFKHKI